MERARKAMVSSDDDSDEVDADDDDADVDDADEDQAKKLMKINPKTLPLPRSRHANRWTSTRP